MRILFTGGAGFIGNYFVGKLVGLGHDVTVLDILKRGNKLDSSLLGEIELVKGDVRDKELVVKSAKKADLIFHFAAVLGVDIVADNPVETMETETLGMQNVIDAAIVNGTQKVVYASTSGVYGKGAIEQAVHEDFDVSPKSSYAIAKRFNEIYLASLYEEKKLESISLRFFNVYGPKQDNRMVIPRFFEQAMSNRPLTVYGTGNQTRDFTYLDDVFVATMKLIEKSSGAGIYNISRESDYTIKELAERIVSLTGSKSQIQFMNPPKSRYDFEVERRFGSSEKLFKLTNFKPSISLDEGLAKVYECYADSREIKLMKEN